MPHFCNCGADEYICQKCAKVLCSKDYPSVWRPDITGYESFGNVCPICLSKYEMENSIDSPDKAPISLYEHCKQESGFTEHKKIMSYLNKYYGFD